MFTVSMIALTLSTVLILVNSMIAKKSMKSRENPSAFECGFDPKSHSRLPFSLRFYLIAVIFLIFDVEITLIIPIPVLTSNGSMMNLSMMMSVFLIILIVGLYHEWNQGALYWK